VLHEESESAMTASTLHEDVVAEHGGDLPPPGDPAQLDLPAPCSTLWAGLLPWADAANPSSAS